MRSLRVKDKELLSMEDGLEKWQYFKLLFPHIGFRLKIQKTKTLKPFLKNIIGIFRTKGSPTLEKDNTTEEILVVRSKFYSGSALKL